MSENNISKTTAENYLNSIGAPMTRMEYLFYLKEANDEGRVMRAMQAAIETKEQWMKQDHWSRFTKDLREEFYIAYRSGYANYKEVEVAK